VIKVFGFGQLDMYTRDWMGKGLGVLVLICILELAGVLVLTSTHSLSYCLLVRLSFAI
jgi:hypothetical protein